MNSTQTQTTTATIIGIVAGFLAGRGAFGFDQATWITIITAVAGAGMAIWTAIATRKTAMVSTVANMNEVKEVTLEKTAPGVQTMNATTPDNVVIK